MIKNKRGQVAMFIIIALIIAGTILLFFSLRGRSIKQVLNLNMPDINNEIEACVKNSVKNSANIMLNSGGKIVPDNYILYKNNKIEYLCYNSGYYNPCVNQFPLLVKSFEEEIKNNINSKIEDCFYSLKKEYEKKNYNFDMSAQELGVELVPKQIRVSIIRKVKIGKNDERKEYSEFSYRVLSPIYDLGIIAQEIANQEAKFCNFEYIGYSLLYPQYEIEKKDINGQAKIYTITEKSSNKKMVFAIRSCAIPAGL